MFLYRPGVFNHPLAEEEFEERADVVVIKHKGAMFDVEQFPVYLTTNQREWNPSWIAPHDEIVDGRWLARKFEHDWTRLDGPYLWYRPDLLSGEVTYRSQAKLQGEAIEIEAERTIESRGAVKRMDRPADYNPAGITPFVAGVDARATGLDLFMVDPPRVDDQANNLKRLGPYFSNGFHAWCRYGRWDSGLAADNRTWVSVPADEPRPGSLATVPSLSQTARGEAASAKP